jgi:hypothetical protein
VRADPVQLVAGNDAFGCEDCPVADGAGGDCRSECRCGVAVPAVFLRLEEPLGLTIAVTVRPHAPAKLPAKLPAI